MPDMPRPRKPYIHREVTRHKTVFWYFRKGKGPRIRLPGVFGSKEFNAAYEAALSGTPVAKAATARQDTFRWLVDRYYESGRYAQLRPNTQRNHRLMLEDVCKTASERLFRKSTHADLAPGVVRRENTPRMAATYASVMRALFAFAKDSGWMDTNPASDLVARQSATDGYHTWTEQEVEAYQARHPIGTQARLAMDIMLYTGLRRSDVVVFGRQHIKGGVISIRAGKNHAEITIPLLTPLAASIDAAKPTCGEMVFLINARRQPWKSNSFGYWFADRCDEAGVPGRAHGLRKAGATFAANNGATPFELTAMYGLSSTKMAEIYTKKADRVRLAERAANKLFPNQPKGSGADIEIDSKNKAVEKSN